MFELTPGERRGALLLLLIVLIGAAWDLAHTDPPMAPPLRERPGAVAGLSAGPGGASPSSGGAPAAPLPSGPVDLNSATASQLDALPGIGPVLAGRIVEHRLAHGPFASVDELLAVRGIGPRSFERLRPLVTAARAGRTRAGDSLQIARPLPR